MRKIKKMKNICFFVLGMMAMLFGIVSIPSEVEAATPRLMVSDYEVSGGSVIGGKEFNLKLTMKNTAAKNTVKNIKVTLATENGEFLPVDGAGTAYVESMDANAEETISFKMKAVKGLEEKSYKVTIKTEYESSNGMGYTVDEAIFIPVTMEQRLNVTDLFVEGGEIHIGDSVEVTAKINNLGEGSLYNVIATLKGDGVDEMSSFVGKVEPGKSGNVDIITLASEVTYEHSKAYLYVTYEDIDGNKQESKQELMVNVSSPVYDDLELIKGEETKSVDWTLVWWIVGTIVVVAIVAVVIINRAKRKKKILEEF